MVMTTAPHTPEATAPTKLAATTDVLLERITVHLARGRAAEGTMAIELALAQHVQWERLTRAVHRGIDQGYAPSQQGGPTEA